MLFVGAQKPPSSEARKTNRPENLLRKKEKPKTKKKKLVDRNLSVIELNNKTQKNSKKKSLIRFFLADRSLRIGINYQLIAACLWQAIRALDVDAMLWFCDLAPKSCFLLITV